MTAEFLFAFTMVIGCGILIFGLTFSLTTIEIAQYIVWSSARAHAVGNDQTNDSKTAGENKYKSLTAAFPLLTGNGANAPWFKMPTTTDSDFAIGDLSTAIRIRSSDPQIDKDNAIDSGGESRHPWVGVQSSIDLILFKSMQIPFLGRVAKNPGDFTFFVRGILFRHPSVEECQNFFATPTGLTKFTRGVKKIPGEPKWSDGFAGQIPTQYSPNEDNGC